jgi:hypothetical protein
MERVVGPIERHWLAAYTVPGPEGHYAYAKIYPVKPASPWDGTPAIWKVAVGPYPYEGPAIDAVVDKAAEEIREASEFQVLWDRDI